MIFVTSGILLEIALNATDSFYPSDQDWKFHNLVYFVIVTISTVGYGDF